MSNGAAREQGASWQQVGDALGMSRQAAHQSYAVAIEAQKEEKKGMKKQNTFAKLFQTLEFEHLKTEMYPRESSSSRGSVKLE